MRILLLLLLALIPIATAYADVELLVKGKENWKDGKPTADWTREDFKDFWKQKHKGEIITALEGGTSLGTHDVPPAIIHITVTGVTLEQARNYLAPLMDDEDINEKVKHRRWHFTRAVVDSAITLWEADSTHLTITKQQAGNLIKEYNIANIKQKIIDRLQR